MKRLRACVVAPILGHFFSGSVIAGMPSFLPRDIHTVLRLRDAPLRQLQAISFFLICLGLSALAVMLLWNFLRKDFPRLPRLSYLRALSVITLWGLVFVVVLTMISGARELMTPAAWTRNGFTYTVKEQPAAPADETKK